MFDDSSHDKSQDLRVMTVWTHLSGVRMFIIITSDQKCDQISHSRNILQSTVSE